MRKILIMLILCLGIGNFISLGEVYAASNNDEIIMPMYANISTASVSLAINGSNAHAVTLVDTQGKCDVSITMKLQKKSGTTWVTIKTWEKSADSVITLNLTKDYTISSGTYRVRSVVKAGGEQATITSISKTKN